MEQRFNFLLVENHQMMRESLADSLKRRMPMSQLYEAGTGAEALQLLEKVKPVLVLMDVMLEDMNGMDLSKRILSTLPNSRIIALSLLRDRTVIRELLKTGVMGYIPKEADMEELLEGIEKVLAGEVFLGKGVSSILFKKDLAPKKIPQSTYFHREPHPDSLTRREIEVLKLIVDEMNTLEIAEKLCISPRTVQSHRKNLSEKIGCRNMIGLAKYAIKHGLVSGE